MRRIIYLSQRAQYTGAKSRHSVDHPIVGFHTPQLGHTFAARPHAWTDPFVFQPGTTMLITHIGLIVKPGLVARERMLRFVCATGRIRCANVERVQSALDACYVPPRNRSGEKNAVSGQVRKPRKPSCTRLHPPLALDGFLKHSRKTLERVSA